MNIEKDNYEKMRKEFLSRTTDASKVFVESVPPNIIKAFSEASAEREKNLSETGVDEWLSKPEIDEIEIEVNDIDIEKARRKPSPFKRLMATIFS